MPAATSWAAMAPPATTGARPLRAGQHVRADGRALRLAVPLFGLVLPHRNAPLPRAHGTLEESRPRLGSVEQAHAFGSSSTSPTPAHAGHSSSTTLDVLTE